MSIFERFIAGFRRFNSFTITFCLFMVLAVSCSDNPSSSEPEPEPEPEPNEEASGIVEVITTTTGLGPNPMGYTVDITDVENFQINANATVTSEEIEVGSYTVELTGVENHCAVQSENPKTINVTENQTTTVEFEIECEGIFRDQIVFFRSQSQNAFKYSKGMARNSMVTSSYYTMNPDGSDIQRAGDLNLDGYVYFFSDISPDGTKMVIAFSENRDGSRSNYRIAIVEAYDSSIQYIIEESDDINYFESVFSPDGTQIAFTGYSTRGLFSDIYVMDADGSNMMKVTNTDELDSQPSWSPDGNRLIFQRDSNDYQYMGLYSVNVDGSGERLINGSELEFSGAEFSPDGNQIVATGTQLDQDGYSYGEVYVMDSDGSNVEMIAGKEGRSIYHSTPRWSPDGNFIIFSSNRAGEPDDEFGYSYQPHDLFRINSDGSNLMNLTNSSGISESNVMWSPVTN